MLSTAQSINTNYASCEHAVYGTDLCIHRFVSKVWTMIVGKGSEDARRWRVKTVKYVVFLFRTRMATTCHYR